jgi:thioredoxin-related protein
MNTIQAYNSLSPITDKSKVELIDLATQQANEIIESGSAEQAWAFLSKMEVLVDNVKKQIKNSVILEVEKQNNSAFGLKMKVKSKRNYSYESDKTWKSLKDDLLKHEAFLKSISEPTTILNESTGEMIQYIPAIITFSEYIENEF